MPNESGTDAVTLLEQDHRAVEQIFEQLQAGGGDQRGLVTQLITELTVHAELEEQLVYPRAKQAISEGGTVVEEAEQEHAEVKQLIAELEETDLSSPRAAELILEIQEGVQHHVHEEEREMFPKMRQTFGTAELMQIGSQVMQQKEQLMASLTGGTGVVGGEIIDLNALEAMTKDELYALAQERGIEGRSDMNKEQLVSVLREG